MIILRIFGLMDLDKANFCLENGKGKQYVLHQLVDYLYLIKMLQCRDCKFEFDNIENMFCKTMINTIKI